MEISRLIQISEELGFSEISQSLKEIKYKMGLSNCPIVLPLVGEFSAGKTTLLNALTDNKHLETATKPTTATIYEVYFGADVCRAEVYDALGTCVFQTTNIEELKNSELADVSMVKVFDTSSKIPSSVVIVDTPGISAPDPRHQQALVDYLPSVDGVLLVSDINQQITASILNFIKTVSLANRPVFLILTMCDLKSSTDIIAAKHYASSISGIPEDNIACVSAQNGDVEQLYCLINNIQNDKSSILDKVNLYRVKCLSEQLSQNIEAIISSSKFDDINEDTISDYRRKISRIKREVDDIIVSVRGEIEETARKSASKFEDIIFDQLDSLAASDGIDYDTAARKTIDSTLRIQFNDYKNSVKNIILKKAKIGLKSDASISLSSLSSVEIDGSEIGSIPYNLNLNELGHQYDDKISTGLKIAAAVAATAAVVATAGAAAPAAAAGTAGAAAGTTGVAGTAVVGAEGAGVAIEAADMILDAGSIVASTSVMSKMRRSAQFADKVRDKYDEIDEKDHAKDEGGAFKSFVGSITDRTLGKPQRRRAIHQYLDSTLMPSYKQGLDTITNSIVCNVSDAISVDVENNLNELVSALSSIQEAQRNNESEYKNRLNQLQQYRKELINS